LSQAGSTGANADSNGGAGFIVGIDDNVDPPGNSFFIDPGVGSQIRILGLGANETTGQSRVPVILTSLRDNTVGKTIRGQSQFKVFNFDPLKPVGYDYNTPAAGDGGYILYGGNSLTDYNPLDPRDGNLIDNADIRYMTRIELQGGGIVDTSGSTATAPTVPVFLNEKLGNTPISQFNLAKTMTISDTNLDSFSDAAVFVHPDAGNAIYRTVTVDPITGQVTAFINGSRGSLRGEPVTLYMYNDTISNSTVGVQVYSETAAVTAAPSQMQVVMLNDTFYNDPVAFHSIAPNFSSGTATPLNDSVFFVAMDSIFDGSKTTGMISDGQTYGSQSQYNLFFNNAQDLAINNPNGGFQGNQGAILGNPLFVNPTVTGQAMGSFALMQNSPAIDAARSELVGDQSGDATYPSMLALYSTTSTQGGIRSTIYGQNGFDSSFELTTLPGLPDQTFGGTNMPLYTEWVAVLQNSSATAYVGTATNAATYAYMPITGERDGAGFLRQDDPGVANVGFGTRPFFDIGAYEYRQFFPPEVVAYSNNTNVLATLSDGTTKDLYPVGTVAGVSPANGGKINTISFKFSHQIDTATITSLAISLVRSNLDGIFGNGNDIAIPLTNNMFSYNAATLVLTINTSSLTLPTDEYEITLSGNGANVLADPQGNALDGENTDNDDPNGAQKALPSGDSIRGGNFYLKFTVDSQPPALVAGTFRLSPASDTNKLDSITRNNTPTFLGTVTDTFPPANPLQGVTVILQVFDYTTGQYVSVGQTLSDAVGNFSVTVPTSLPDSPYNVGSDGLLSINDAGHGLARVVLVDAAGNTSTSGPISFIIDTQPPNVTAFTPAPGSLVSTAPTVSFTVDKNIDPSSLNANSVLVFRPGPDNVFGTGDDISVPLTGISFVVTPLPGQGAKGPEQISFTFPAGTVNDQYEVVLKGSGATPITDIAGNVLDGGNDFSSIFVVSNPSAAHLLFVGSNFITDATATVGSRANPYTTISAAIAAAGVGDIVAVLPQTYIETITLKSLVQVLGASPNSTDAQYLPGNALQTVLRSPAGSGNFTPVVSASALISVPGLPTQLSGLTIVSALFGSQANGTLDPTSIGVFINNSNVTISHNIIITSGFGIDVILGGPDAPTPTIESNLIVGNSNGIYLDGTNAGGVTAPVAIDGNTFSDNTWGLVANVTASGPIVASVGDNIFWENHDQTTSRNGGAIIATAPNKVGLRGDMFFGNGPSETDPIDDVVGVGEGFVPSSLNSVPDTFGNFVGNPSFVAPRDPRPGSAGGGPGAFFSDVNYGLNPDSAAIDAALDAFEPTLDLLYRGRVTTTPGNTSSTPLGDIGAYEFYGTATVRVGGQFQVTNTSLASTGSQFGSGRNVTVQMLGTSFVISFSEPIDPKSVDPTDLIVSGSGVGSVQVINVFLSDAKTLVFQFAGNFNSSGTVNLTIPGGSIMATNGDSVAAFSDSVQIVSPTTLSTPVVTPTPVQTPAPAAPPTKKQKKAAAKAAQVAAKAAKQAAQHAAKQAKLAHQKAAKQAKQAKKAAHHRTVKVVAARHGK
jgi:large repetitive protein